MNDYMLFRRERLSPVGSWPKSWDIFISGYNTSPRVNLIAGHAPAGEKHWLLLPEYQFARQEYPSGSKFTMETDSEAEFIGAFLGSLPDLSRKSIAIDITGLVSHYVLVLVALLRRLGVPSCDLIYGEPTRYLQSERTKFSDEAVLQVRQVAGFEGIHTTDTSNDLLVMAVGYDFKLVSEVANDKEHSKKVQLFGLPSLRPDMYQQNIISASKVAEAVGPEASDPHHFRYAPANDPFVTASVVSSIAKQHKLSAPHSNVYLAPLSTKAQALGFAIYYLKECVGSPTSVLFPFCKRYMRETSEGLSGVWLYRLELTSLGIT